MAIPAEERSKIDGAIEKIHKKYADAAVTIGELEVKDVDVIPTGALSLDLALGVGGIPRGRITEIYGPEGCGKTTLALHVVAQAQEMGLVAAFIDAEHALDPVYATEGIGVNWDDLIFAQPDSGEEALETLEHLTTSGAVGVIVIDSVAALAPEEELKGDISDKQVGAQARMMSKSIRMIKAEINRANVAVIFINQIRDKIGGFGYGSPETTPGGRALKFYSTLRMDIRRIAAVRQGSKETSPIGNRTKVKIVKNKVAPPYRVCEYDIIFGDGISAGGCLMDMGEKYKIIQKRGSHYSFGDVKLGMGKQNAVSFLKDNEEVYDLLQHDILKAYQDANTKVSDK